LFRGLEIEMQRSSLKVTIQEVDIDV